MQENKIKAGPYIGQFESGCVAWHGIKYASARRFAMPEQRLSTTNDVVCHKFGLSAAQAANPTAKASFAEDILSLNIYSPSADNKRRPVMVWIHGGAFQSGAGSFYNGAQFARDGDIVVVTINYRLGILGFADLHQLGVPRNLGLHDQIAALRWVKMHIEKFGGDPDCVTIAGESAGSASVGLLMIAKGCKGYFHRAIMQSGGLNLAQERGYSELIGARCKELLGTDVDGVDALRKVAIERLMAVQKQLSDEFQGGLAFAPVFDGDVLPASLDQAIKHPTPDVPLLAGSNLEEIRFFEFQPFKSVITSDRGALLKRVAVQHGDAAALRVAGAYGDTKVENRELATDANFGQPTRNFAERHSAQGRDAWVYRFDAPGLIGATHGVELAYLWPLTGFLMVMIRGGFMTGKRQRLADRMRRSWIDFIRTGCPEPAWPRYDKNKRCLKIFNWRDEVVDDAHKNARLAWDGMEMLASQ